MTNDVGNSKVDGLSGVVKHGIAAEDVVFFGDNAIAMCSLRRRMGSWPFCTMKNSILAWMVSMHYK
ncbi:hypothetical protein PDIG_54710 [Penicillium digitatum PHI26]|uniref:Uncharacterized protein n=2 Tax=Penicillium digitatum TaxID=36651 RepID=K9FMD2_PEND2|nr:hypothetical protein PDIP_49920 [Penicillium digitatum Pd1]EKV10790.1 hypothetical protein PDIG_54710 [Penicillium digitatum PHI26]EKV13134.1 hypothetical protein PDIP_49920 [Penicillium digitatum Pd1]